MYRDKTNVEYEMSECTGNTWNHAGGKRKFKEILEAIP
jgi:hypothetical protein